MINLEGLDQPIQQSTAVNTNSTASSNSAAVAPSSTIVAATQSVAASALPPTSETSSGIQNKYDLAKRMFAAATTPVDKSTLPPLVITADTHTGFVAAVGGYSDAYGVERKREIIGEILSRLEKYTKETGKFETQKVQDKINLLCNRFNIPEGYFVNKCTYLPRVLTFGQKEPDPVELKRLLMEDIKFIRESLQASEKLASSAASTASAASSVTATTQAVATVSFIPKAFMIKMREPLTKDKEAAIASLILKMNKFTQADAVVDLWEVSKIINELKELGAPVDYFINFTHQKNHVIVATSVPLPTGANSPDDVKIKKLLKNGSGSL